MAEYTWSVDTILFIIMCQGVKFQVFLELAKYSFFELFIYSMYKLIYKQLHLFFYKQLVYKQ